MAYKPNKEMFTIGISSPQQPTVLGRLVIVLHESRFKDFLQSFGFNLSAGVVEFRVQAGMELRRTYPILYRLQAH